MPSQLTFTGPIGPGNTVTAKVFTGVTNVDYNLTNYNMRIVCDQGIIFVDINAITTITHTISSKNHTITIT